MGKIPIMDSWIQEELMEIWSRLKLGLAHGFPVCHMGFIMAILLHHCEV